MSLAHRPRIPWGGAAVALEEASRMISAAAVKDFRGVQSRVLIIRRGRLCRVTHDALVAH